ncbi:MAG: c-type cytochrome [Gemmatimonadaceae bacterium]|nr:c-type cytochrome [Gemmatimonadaceae bacterium]
MADKSAEDRLLDHEYDGIQEYDNPLPRWWLWILYATVIFAVAYYFLPLPFGEGPGKIAEYEAEVAKYEAMRPPPADPSATADQLASLVGNAQAIADGKVVFDANCAACHRPDGGGMIGPNLTDNAWIHGGTPAEIHATVANGVLEKGMPPWERILRPEQVNAVTAYVISLAGTNPPNPKAPEGTVIP